MAVSKCVKCGADIPAGAEFCPACGAPKGGGQPAAQPVAQPAPVKSGGASFQGSINMLFSRMMITIGLFIGILVIWIIRIIGQFYAHVALTITYLTFIAGLGGFLFCAGFLNSKLNVYVRAALIVAGAALIATHL